MFFCGARFAKTKTSFKRNNGGKAKSSEQMSKKRFKKEFKSKTKNSQTKNTESIGDKKKSENMEGKSNLWSLLYLV